MYSLEILGIKGGGIRLGQIPVKIPYINRKPQFGVKFMKYLGQNWTVFMFISARTEQFLKVISAGTEEFKTPKKNAISSIPAESSHKNCSIPAKLPHKNCSVPTELPHKNCSSRD